MTSVSVNLAFRGTVVPVKVSSLTETCLPVTSAYQYYNAMLVSGGLPHFTRVRSVFLKNTRENFIVDGIEEKKIDRSNSPREIM